MRDSLLMHRCEPQTTNECQFCKQVSELSSVSKLTPDHAMVLKAYLNQGVHKPLDPYVRSGGYLLSTGRRGIWVYTGAESPVVFCLHPNLRDVILIYPIDEFASFTSISDCVELLSVFPLNLKIARVPAETGTLNALADVLTSWDPLPVEEPILDWRFPVHTIDARDLRGKEGKKYQKIRQSLNKYGQSLKMREMSRGDRDAIFEVMRIGREWTESVQPKHEHQSSDECNNCFFHYLYRLTKSEQTGVRFFMFTLEGTPVAFSVVECPGVANLLASQVLPGYPHLADCVIYETASFLVDEGCPYFCLGGSENEGMDRFKRKFSPIVSYPLRSINLPLQNRSATKGSVAELRKDSDW